MQEKLIPRRARWRRVCLLPSHFATTVRSELKWACASPLSGGTRWLDWGSLPARVFCGARDRRNEEEEEEDTTISCFIGGGEKDLD